MTYDLNIPSRWSDYFLRKNEDAVRFWECYLTKEKKILFILGLGFDPRMCKALQTILKAGGKGKCHCFLVELDEGVESPSKIHDDKIKSNRAEFENLIPEENRTFRTLQMWSEDRRAVGSTKAANLFDADDLTKYTDVIIDVSAIPRGVYFPIVGKILTLIEQNDNKPNLHLVATENSDLDSSIMESGLDETASYMQKFTGGLDDSANTELPKIWIPLLGENQEKQFLKIYQTVHPSGICPLFPMPSTDPRKLDKLLAAYRKHLFNSFNVGSDNFIFASEQNPFEVYREIRTAVKNHFRTLDPVGGCKIVISPLSGKLPSIGACLAAFELKDLGVGICHVEAQGYVINSQEPIDKIGNDEFFTMWLAGDCYAS